MILNGLRYHEKELSSSFDMPITFSKLVKCELSHLIRMFPEIVLGGNKLKVNITESSSDPLKHPVADSAVNDVVQALKACVNIEGSFQHKTCRNIDEVIKQQTLPEREGSPSESDIGPEEAWRLLEVPPTEPEATPPLQPPPPKRMKLFQDDQQYHLVKLLQDLRLAQEAIKLHGYTNDIVKHFLCHLFKLSVHEREDIRSLMSTTTHENQRLAMTIKMKSQYETKGVVDVAIQSEDERRTYIIGEGKTGEAQLLIAMLATFVQQKGEYPVFGVLYSTLRSTVMQVNKADGDVSITCHDSLHHQNRLHYMDYWVHEAVNKSN